MRESLWGWFYEVVPVNAYSGVVKAPMCWSAQGDPRGLVLVIEAVGMFLVFASPWGAPREVEAMCGSLRNGDVSVLPLLVFKY